MCLPGKNQLSVIREYQVPQDILGRGTGAFWSLSLSLPLSVRGERKLLVDRGQRLQCVIAHTGSMCPQRLLKSPPCVRSEQVLREKYRAGPCFLRKRGHTPAVLRSEQDKQGTNITITHTLKQVGCLSFFF